MLVKPEVGGIGVDVGTRTTVFEGVGAAGEGALVGGPGEGVEVGATDGVSTGVGTPGCSVGVFVSEGAGAAD